MPPKSTSVDTMYQLPPAPSVAPRRRRWPMAIFWLLFILIVLGLVTDEGRPKELRELPLLVQFLISPLMLFVMWVVMNRFRPQLNKLMRVLPLPSWMKFFGCGFLIGIGLGANFAISFNLDGKDIYSDPILNTIAYVGTYGGIMLGWYVLRHFFAFNARHVFWISGSTFALFEQHSMIFLHIITGTAILVYPLLVVSYGVPLATPFLLMPEEELPQGKRRLSWWGVLLCAIVALMMFTIGGSIWFFLLDLLFGVGTPNI